MEYKLVLMDRSHLKEIAAIERACFSTPWSEGMLGEELYNERAAYLVAEGPQGEVLGYAGLHVVMDEGYITNIAVSPSCRRKGVGGALLGALKRFAGARLAFLTLEMRASNQEAAALYRKHGFEEVGRRKNYYSHPEEDAVMMTWEVSHGDQTPEERAAERPV